MSNAAKEDLVPCTQVAPGEDRCGLNVSCWKVEPLGRSRSRLIEQP